MEAASELFYREGMHAITADRVAEEAGLTKPTIYNLFGSKDDLVRESLERRAEQIRDAISNRTGLYSDAERKLLEVLEIHAEMLTSPGFHGCPLVIAAIQSPESDYTRELAGKHKNWLHGLMAQLGRKAGYRSPDTLAWALLLMLEGAAAMSTVHPADIVVKQARAAAKSLLACHRQEND